MSPDESERYAKCPHCGEPIGVRALIRSLPATPITQAPAPASANPFVRGPARAALPDLREAPRVAPRPAPVPGGRSSAAAGLARRWRNLLPVRIWKRYFPPVRLVWIFLLVLVWNVGGFVSRAVAEPLLFLPAVAAVADLGLQATRFPRLRIPDAAIANGLFLSVILWPTSISLEMLAVVAAAVGVRHLLRWGGHPVLNPAAVGVTIAAVVFALPQPWHVGYTLQDTALVALLGLVLWSRAWHTWRLWAVFFAVNIGATLALADHFGGAAALPLVIQSSVLGTAPIFYGFFMVTEPRTAPSARWPMILYGILVGATSAGLPFLLGLYPTWSALGVLTPYLALFLGNVFAVVLPSARGARVATRRRSARPASSPVVRPTPDS